MGTSSSSHSRRESATDITLVVIVAAVYIGWWYFLYSVYKGRLHWVNRVHRWFSGEEQEQQPQILHQRRAFDPDSISNFILECASFGNVPGNNTIVIAVDATKERAGGVLRFPRTKTIYFYSIEWSIRFRFPNEPDKFEMANIFLALVLFKPLVSRYRLSESDGGQDDPLVFKNDNSICLTKIAKWRKFVSETTYNSGLQYRFRELFKTTHEKLGSQPFCGVLKHVTKSTDKDLKIADKLSRQAVESPDGLPRIDHFDYSGYSYKQIRNLSFSIFAREALFHLQHALPDDLLN